MVERELQAMIFEVERDFEFEFVIEVRSLTFVVDG